ncbi:MAG: lytic transglycosylase domain-containing protein, partial [Candidatus Hydrogenedentota bacterium]
FTHAYLKEKKKQEDIFLMSKLAYDALYPRPFLNVVKKVSQRFSLEPARIYALMKQESSFFLSATSPAGASGIMQVMPYTAKDLNRRLKIKNLDLHNPNHSILLGAKFYADMSKMFHGDFEKIAMAYNAGPGRLLEWEKRFAGVPKVLFLEEIPFEETYYYVKKTRKYYDRYKIGFEYFF